MISSEISPRLQRTRRPAPPDSSHVCGARSIFTDVHAAGKNGLQFISPCGETLRGVRGVFDQHFFDICKETKETKACNRLGQSI
jgi:hypothetical protein